MDSSFTELAFDVLIVTKDWWIFPIEGRWGNKGEIFFCTPHYRQLFLSNPEAINYSRAGVGRRDKVEETMEGGEVEVVKPVKPVSRLDKVVEIDEQVEEGEGEGEMEVEMIGSPVVINIMPPGKEDEGERKKERGTSAKKKKQKEVKSAVEPVRQRERGGREREGREGGEREGGGRERGGREGKEKGGGGREGGGWERERGGEGIIFFPLVVLATAEVSVHSPGDHSQL